MIEPRPAIVLVPDAMPWILGRWAQQIAHWNAEQCDFSIFPIRELRADPQGFRTLLACSDVVHCLSPWDFAPVRAEIAASGIGRIAQVATVHHVVDFEDVREASAADRIGIECSETAERLVAAGVSEQKFFPMRVGVDTEFFRPLDRTLARARFELGPGDFAIGFSAKCDSNPDDRKGFDTLIEVVSRFASEIDAPVHLIITGPGWNERLAALRNVELHYFPFLPDEAMPSYYSALDVYLSTARIEGGPLPPLEAMSCGTAVVSTRIGTIRDFATDAVDALLTVPDDPAGSLKALRRLFEGPELRRRLGAAGRELVVRELRWRDSVSGLSEIYRELASLRPARRDSISTRERGRQNDERIERDRRRWLARAGVEPKSFLQTLRRRWLRGS